MMICDSICIGEWLFLFMWFISVPVYCMVMYTIVKNRSTKFKEEFWLLAISLFVADMLHLCQYMWGTKMASWGYVPSFFKRIPNVIGWLMRAPQTAFLCAEVMGVVFVSLNRYVAVTKPLQYEILWSRKKTYCCIGAQWAVACFVILFMIPFRFTLVQQLDKNESSFATTVDPLDNKFLSVFYAVIVGIGGCVRVVLFTILYGRMFYHVYKEGNQRNRERSSANPQRSSNKKAEFNLAIMGSILALLDVVLTLHVFNLVFALQAAGDSKLENEIKVRYFFFRGACISDVYGWVNGWLLLACCEKVRKEFWKLFGCKLTNQGTNNTGPVVHQGTRTR